MKLYPIGVAELQLEQGDITRIPVDAMANAANSELAGGGGVDGAIHRTGGEAIMRELDVIRAKIGHCPPGHAVATTAGKLPAKFVFHAVGPIYRGGNHGEPEQLASCYTICLSLAAERGVSSISFPSISTGVYGYPVDEAAEIAIKAVSGWLTSHSSSVRLVKLVQFSEFDHTIYANAAEAVLKNLPSRTVGASLGGSGNGQLE